MLTRSLINFRQPFWLATLISAGLSLLTLIILIIIYGQIGQWQYLALAGVAAVIVIVHGLAWKIVHLKGRFDLGLWLIAATQILSVVAIPLFMADYWLLGPFLLLVVPLEIGVADQLKRIPLFIVASLLGAAGMLATDLLTPTDRLMILTDLPGAAILAITLLTLLLVSQMGLLWYFRLRPQASHRVKLDLATQQALVFTAIATAAIVLVTGVLIAQIRASQIEQVGQNFQTVAEIEAERVGNALEQQINVLTLLIRQETDLADGLVKANESYPDSKTESKRLLQEQEQRWQMSVEDDLFVLQYRSNPQSLALSKFRGTNIFHNNIFLTDRLGGLIAAQGEQPAKFYYGDEPWWQTAWSNGQGDVYLGRLAIDPQTKFASIFIAVGLVNPKTNQTIGVIASTFELRTIQRDLSLARPQTTGEVTLVTPDGVIVASPEEAAIGQPAWASLLASGFLTTATADSASIEPGWFLGTDRQDTPAVLAHAPLVTTSRAKLGPLRNLGWQIVVSDTQDNALAGVTQSTKIASLVGVLAMAMVVLAAMAMARVITRPIEALTTAAAAISEGDLERQTEPVGPVELVTLAEAFNTLTTRLRTLINSLQDQVAQRTAQLETLFRQERQQRQIAESLRQVATILNTSLDRDTVLAKIMEQLGGVIRYNGASIFLQEGDDLVITRGAILADGYLGYRIPLASADPTIRVFEQRQPLIIADVRLDPHWEVWEAGASIRSWMGAPLLTGEQAIGVLTVDNFEIGAYSEEDAQVLQIFANQAATAIGNARLYTEAQEARVAAEVANRELFEALKNLQATQSQLVEAEKMAALGGLVAGVAHEINTPVGVGVTAASLLEDKTAAFSTLFQTGQMKRSDLEKYLDTASQSSGMILKNLQRAAELIQSFKQVAVDQSSEERRIFAVKPYLEEVLLSLHPKLKRTHLATEIYGDDNLTLDSFPGAFAQIVTNLVMNSLIHAYEPNQPGQLTFNLKQKQGQLVFEYADDGRGIPKEYLGKIFDPFFTTKRGQGGSGLGLHIIYNLVSQKLDGTIRCESEVGRGTRFMIELPLSMRSKK